MKKIIYTLLFSGWLCGLSAQPGIDVLHYTFHIGLSDENDTIEGLAEIRLRFLQTGNHINIDLTAPGSNGKGMKVSKVSGSGVSGSDHNAELLRVNFSGNFSAGDTATLFISYSGIPSDGLIISKTKYGRRSFFADNWPDRGHHWIPCHDDPADKATLEFIVTAPDHYQVVANGVQIEESTVQKGFKLTHWKEDTPLSPKVMVIGAADFAVNLAGYVSGRIPVYSWVYPEDREKGFYDYAQAVDILPYYIEQVGPYGYKKLANVQSKTRFGGLENANTIFYSENSVRGNRRSEGLLAHEIAHQWFGNMATEKSFGHLWLSEGFATYFTILYFENKYGKDTATYMLLEDREQVISWSNRSSKPVVDTAETNYMNLLNANSYQKGGWVLHMLRSQIGDELFWKAIRDYYSKYAGGIAGTEDLQHEFEKVSGLDLAGFFRQWLYTPGQPELVIQWKYDAAKKEIRLTIEQVQKETFQFPLEIGFRLPSGKPVINKFFIDNKTRIFSIPAAEKPLSIMVDPATKLLAHWTIRDAN